MSVATLIPVEEYLMAKYRESGLEVWPEQRIQITSDHYRVVDVCITLGEPEEQIFTTPPAVCVEILSRRDTLAELQDTVDDRRAAHLDRQSLEADRLHGISAWL